MFSKIGPHAVIGPSKNFAEYLERIRQSDAIVYIKCVDDYGKLKESENAVGRERVFSVIRDNKTRNGIDAQGMNAWAESGKDPAEAVREYLAAYEPTWAANPADAVECFNEWSEWWAWQSEFYIEMMKQAGDRYKFAIFSTSTGNPPNAAAAVEMIPALKYAKEHDHYLSMHNYGGVGADENGNPNPLTLKGTEPWHALRHRWLYDQVWKPANADAPLLLTEVAEAGGFDFLGTDVMMDDVRWYEDEIAKDDYVVGAFWFTLGKWNQSNFQDALPALAEHIVTYTPPEQPDTPPEQPPIVDRGKPRIDYRRTVNVVPPDDPSLNAWSWYTYRLTGNENRAVSIFLEGWRRGRETTGGSYDDAFVGDLTHRLGNLFDIAPDNEQDFVTFRDDWYPGGIIDFRESIDLSEPDETEPPPDPEPFRLVWPTDYKVYTQRFGVRPEYYGQFGLPGHEGVDIRCPSGGNVYACADGIVTERGWRRDGHPYGYAIRIEHPHDVDYESTDPDDDIIYRTIYAHLQEDSAVVRVNENVEAGQLIGLGDSTGNVDGAHLHLMLKKAGATARGETTFPHDIVNPELYLPDIDTQPPPSEETHTPPSWLHLAATGLHPNDPNGSFMTDLQMLRDAKMDGFVFTTNSDIDPDGLGILLDQTDIKPENVIIRLFMPGTDLNIADPAEYVRLHRAWIDHGLHHGVKKFQLWNEPNLDQSMVDAGKIRQDQMEWPHDAATFARVFAEVSDKLFREYDTDVKIGFPAMSPQDNAYDYYWEAMATTAANWADWFAIHAYFSTDGSGLYGIDSQTGGLYWQHVLEWIPADVLCYITEFADNGNGADVDRARRTVAYLTQKYPKRIKGLAAYISQDANWPKQEWVSNPHVVGAVAVRGG